MDLSTFNIYPLMVLFAVLVLAALLSGLRSRILLLAGMYSGAIFVIYYTFAAVFSERVWPELLQLLLGMLLFYLFWGMLWWLLQKYAKPCHDEGATGFLLPAFIFPVTLFLACLTRAGIWLFDQLFS